MGKGNEVSMIEFAQKMNAKADSKETQDALEIINNLPLCSEQRNSLVESMGKILNNARNENVLRKGKMVCDIEDSMSSSLVEPSVSARITAGVNILAEATERLGENRIKMQMDHAVLGNVKVLVVISQKEDEMQQEKDKGLLH